MAHQVGFEGDVSALHLGEYLQLGEDALLRHQSRDAQNPERTAAGSGSAEPRERIEAAAHDRDFLFIGSATQQLFASHFG